MKIKSYSLGQLQANCYFLIEENECLIIDPADEASFILEELQKRKLKLVGMLATHGHFDHVMAAGEIQKSFNILLHVSKNDIFLIDRLGKTAEYFLGYSPMVIKPISIKHLIEIKMKIRKFVFNCLFTPGHTPGSVCFYFPKEKVIFTGDTLFKGGIGRYDFTYADKKKLKDSLNNLLTLPKDTIVYPGHGDKSTIEEEQNILNLFSL
ncbi:hypothetical protein A3C98_05585 [Candidatus Roizmanbacteria bacterium RIFCSPHIGHO2_02_FULL_37_15]|uniref:Metallo-beta-lactamase domain-containing protein n=1 Tax=Candidatus Roizmanbacteria bacterium RIFCSPLOWO2_01_FULL_37_16 TaxID=1802058 RepID=A0A1F7IPR6_9BACT|nr:MAG: hypothetical protein A3C98_05585 [Candidatus Roizmanbacteria bacterium RIFCSPHIGHO2_02_FULL_37_15]OGK34124.1 MAG: hypothetical protein A3F57_00550 [Candidatus Roizmanbacteria bacterium RIFCSPHIGHO2_12_FULL_36_11]OGK45354.1 MAG: hypothetical protein A3B40_03325 [Candidatus Roizmanbacteria bacterium RIFCSPLOWO2_01_FULL_37_16]OGK57655.1 MAG: hypothetical protein A3I50_03880 [Candidatus Roizmanbacteria bacterium RIFCSPLOWO2_02_FULL_37_9]